jgi:hypothetical protein
MNTGRKPSKHECGREQIRAGFRSLTGFGRLAMLDELEQRYCLRCGCVKGTRTGCRCEEFKSPNTSSLNRTAWIG